MTDLEKQPDFEPSFPPWYTPSHEEKEESEENLLTEETLDKIIQKAFQIIGESFDRYEIRHSQIEMSVMILKSLYHEKTAVIEAGTGIGKSFAYIVASLAYSYLKGHRIVLTTETKNLQMQIYHKDLKFIQKVLDPNLKFELCLGSSNYLCKLRYEETFTSGSFRNLINQEEINSFHSWAKEVFREKKTGSVYETDPPVNHAFWSLVNRDSDGCPGMKCEYFKGCNYFHTKQLWHESRVLIVNHHLLLFHLQNEKKTLPEYACIIVDEAHGFLKTAYSIYTLVFRNHSLSDHRKKVEKLPLFLSRPFR